MELNSILTDKGPPVRIRTIGGWWVWHGSLPPSGVPIFGDGDYLFQAGV